MKKLIVAVMLMAMIGCKKEEPIKRYKFVAIPIMNQTLIVNGEQKNGFAYGDSLEVGSENTFTMLNKAGECLLVIIVNDSIVYEMRSKNSITTQIKI